MIVPIILQKGGFEMIYLNKPKNFVPDLEAVGCMVYWRGQILMLKRRPDDLLYPNVWGFPSGKVERGESPTNAMFRELEEETGIKASSLGILGKCYVIYPQLQFTYHMYWNNNIPLMSVPEIRLNPREHVAFRFDTPENIIASQDNMLDVDDCIKQFYPYHE